MNTRELGRWRKLWTHPSAAWELLPLSARGLGDELIRYCDERGQITRPAGMALHEVIARLLRAHHSEMRRLKADIDALVRDKFLVVTDDAITIRNFVEAQRTVTESGERMREKRARDAELPRAGAELPRAGADDNTAKTIGLPRHCDASERREEKRREEVQSARESQTAEAPDMRRSADAVLAAFFGSRSIDHRATPGVMREFIAACRELSVTPNELRGLSEYLDANRESWAWTRRTKLDLAWLLGGARGRGSNLTEQIAKARDWQATHAARERREAEQRAYDRRAVDAAIAASAGVDPKRSAQRALEAAAAMRAARGAA